MIYLVRHGQTQFNAERRQQGRLDSDLTPLGLSQAAAVGRLLQGLTGKPAGWRLVASPLGRAQATADPRVTEVSFGEWDGRLRDELAAEHPEVFARKDWQFSAPGGERYEDVHARVSGWLADLPPESHRKVIVVSHGGAGRVLRGAFLGLSREETWAQAAPQDAVFRMANAAIVRFDCQPAEP